MPTVNTTEITGYAHCQRFNEAGILCPGNEQEPVPAIREEVFRNGIELGAENAQAIDRSSIHIRWANPGDVACKVCGAPRELADQVRPVYPSSNLTAQPERHLNAEVSDLRAQLRDALTRLDSLGSEGGSGDGGSAAAPRETPSRPSRSAAAKPAHAPKRAPHRPATSGDDAA